MAFLSDNDKNIESQLNDIATDNQKFVKYAKLKHTLFSKHPTGKNRNKRLEKYMHEKFPETKLKAKS